MDEKASPLWIVGCVPCVAVLVGLYVWDSAWGSIILLHLTMVLLCAYVSHCAEYWAGEWEALDLQLRSGLALLFFSLLSLTISFLAFTTVPGSNLLSVLVPLTQGLQEVTCSYFLFSCDTEYIVGFVLYFSIVNPLLEEAFWRLYLYKLLPRTEKWKWGVSVMYAAYHIIVVLRFSHLSQAILSGLGLCLLGRILVLVRETSGWLAACLLHSGLDMGLMGIWLYLLFVVS